MVASELPVLALDTGAHYTNAATLVSIEGIQSELWIGRAAAAVAFYQAAFGARVLHRVGEGDEIVAQPAIGDTAFWVSSGGADGPRFSPEAIGGATGRTLLLVDEPDATLAWSRPVPLRRPRWPTSMAGAWAGSSTRSAMGGKSAGRWACGRQFDVRRRGAMGGAESVLTPGAPSCRLPAETAR
jgi:hypothetical protein